jgi:hypothetical protein
MPPAEENAGTCVCTAQKERVRVSEGQRGHEDLRRSFTHPLDVGAIQQDVRVAERVSGADSLPASRCKKEGEQLGKASLCSVF